MASKKIVVMGDRDSVTGFRLAGVKEAHVADAGNANEVYEKIKDSDSLFLITEEVEQALGAKKIEELRSRTLVQVIPADANYSVVAELIKDAIGLQLGAGT